MLELIAKHTDVPEAVLRKLDLLLLSDLNSISKRQRAFILRLTAYMLKMHFSTDAVLLFIKPHLKNLLDYALSFDQENATPAAIQILDSRYSMLLPPINDVGRQVFDIETGDWVVDLSEIPQVGVTIYLWHAVKLGLQLEMVDIKP